MYDGSQYDTYSFVDEDTVEISTFERDYFDPDFTCFLSSSTITLTEAVSIWIAKGDDGYALYDNYFNYRTQFGEKQAEKLKELIRAAGMELDPCFKDFRDFLIKFTARRNN